MYFGIVRYRKSEVNVNLYIVKGKEMNKNQPSRAEIFLAAWRNGRDVRGVP